MSADSGPLSCSASSKRRGSLGWRIVDEMAGLGALVSLPIVYAAARYRRFERARSIYRSAGVYPIRHHYYSPTVTSADLNAPLDSVRQLPAIDMAIDNQLNLIAQFKYKAELLAIPAEKPGLFSYGYRNTSYGPGDAEIYYNIIRHFRPRRIVEVGSGQSTLIGRKAIIDAKAADSAYDCDYICIEPYEQPWLEQLGLQVHRKRLQDCDDELFQSLNENDILFVDSSHVIRPQGDVVRAILNIIPRLRPGVIIQFHDVFTPRDYPAEWVLQDQRMWDEQYLVEAFLSFNREFEILIALNLLANDFRDYLKDACPVMCGESNLQPAAFWLRRKMKV